MDPELLKRWQCYLGIEETGARNAALQALSTFVDYIASCKTEDRAKWVTEICQQAIDKRQPTLIRHPLFLRVLFPVLLDMYRRREPGGARWLAGFDQHLHSIQCRSEFKNEFPTRLSLLNEALEHDPTDSLGRQELIKELAGFFNYTVHEIPSGVLCGVDGASAKQCDELIAELDRFEKLTEQEGSTELYHERVSYWRKHYIGYKKYLQNRERWQSYAAYLAENEN